jgi:sigma-B regulation protein RsbU (phosphoserine phosphatase)
VTSPSDAAHGDLWRRAVDLVSERQRSGIVVQTFGGEIVDHNAAALTVLQMTADQLLGRSSLDPTWEAVDSRLRRVAGDEHPSMRVARTGRPVRGGVLGVRAGTGEYRWLSVDAWPFSHDGVDYVVSQFSDVTAEFSARARLDDAIEHLQRHALPSRDVEVPWIGVSTRYRSVTEPLEIGGDFLDIVAVSDDRCAFFIGDVCGHDLSTVSTMMAARHTLRSLLVHLEDPGEALAWLHDGLRVAPDSTYCSAIAGLVERRGDRVTVRWANAGHPAPIVVRPDSVERLVGNGRLVNATDDFEPPPVVDLTLGPDDQLVVYSDGLLDSVDPRLDPTDLVARLDRARARGIDDAIDVVDELLADAERQGREGADDTAVMRVRRTS